MEQHSALLPSLWVFHHHLLSGIFHEYLSEAILLYTYKLYLIMQSMWVSPTQVQGIPFTDSSSLCEDWDQLRYNCSRKLVDQPPVVPHIILNHISEFLDSNQVIRHLGL